MTIYLGENIKKLRRERELTQETLAEFLGITFQSVSNWERNESYPDITMLPEIAAFFRVSIDELLGINKSENEQEIITKIREYDNLTDEKLMQEIITDLKKKFPNDFRVLIRYLGCLVRFTKDLSTVSSEVAAIYNNIQQNCTDDRIRIKAKRAMIEFYRAQLGDSKIGTDFDTCEKIIKEMPDMRDSREMFSFFYPLNHPEYDKKIWSALEENFLLRLTLFTHIYIFNKNCTDEWQIEASKKELELLEFIYNDGNYGKMWRTVMNLHGHIGSKYHAVGDDEKALDYFRKNAELAIAFDGMERITTMHSTIFEGKEFDKHTQGSTFIAKSRVKELLIGIYELSDEFKSSDGFKEIISMLE